MLECICLESYVCCIIYVLSVPRDLMKNVVVPVVKNKTGNISDVNNFRPISLATIIAKVLDGLLDRHLDQYLNLQDAQFGFRAGLSTESAVLTLKETVKYYTSRKTPVYACFLDLSKAFDLVSYPVLWAKLKRTGLPQELINIFRYWYEYQDNQVRWAHVYSDTYRLECGVRQGGRSSPKLFSLYMNALIEELSSMHAGCSIDNQMINNISYADDMVLLSPSVCALRDLLRVCEDYAEKHGLQYNVKKSMFMIFAAGSISPSYVPPVRLYGAELVRVYKFTYLGHVVTADMKDDCDIDRERRALAVRGNMLARRFARCTKDVKVTLFKAFCQNLYTCSLWVDYTQKSLNALRVQYNNIFRVMLGLPRHCSASGMFAESRVDGFFAIIRKRIASLKSRILNSSNIILKVIADRQDSALKAHWMSALVCKYINYIN